MKINSIFFYMPSLNLERAFVSYCLDDKIFLNKRFGADNMFKVAVTEDARDFILKKAKAVTVKAMMHCGGTCGLTMIPVVWEGEPSEPEDYDVAIADGIKVYILKDAVIDPEGVRIFLEGDSFIYQALEVKGLRYPA